MIFDGLQIGIPSRSRPHRQITIFNLSEDLWPNIFLMVPSDQYYLYRENTPLAINVIGCYEYGVHAQRQAILQQRATGKVIMFDDDLTFYRRLSEDASKFVRMGQSESLPMVWEICNFLDRYVMVGMVDKFMSQTRPRGHVECSRCNKVLAFNRDMFPNPWPSFRIPHDEDHDVHLQLITQGYRTAVLTEYSKSDPVEAPGGCTDWRSPEVFAETYRLLLEYWPTIVTVVGEKKVRYNWKEAKRIGGIAT